MTLQSNNPVAPLETQEFQDVPLKIAAGSNFGRYPKISVEATYNMIVSDGFLVPYAGYKSVLVTPFQNANGVGRGLYTSIDADIMLAVVGSNVYKINAALIPEQVNIVGGNVIPLLTTTGDVFITENNGNQIVVTDNVGIYVYNWKNGSFFGSDVSFAPNNFYFGETGASAGPPFVPGTPVLWGSSPGHCAFQNGRVIVAVQGTQQWVLSSENDARLWPHDAQHQGLIQSKPGFVRAAIPLPGGGNNLMVFGSTVVESWTDYGLATFPYQKNTSFNVDYGVVNPSSIAQLDNFIVWISTNEISGPVVMVSEGGGKPIGISTDGIDFLLSRIKNPSDATGFLFKQDGHILYQFTFTKDNITLAYDFNTKLFFYATDEHLNYHPARQVVFYRGNYYFVSFNDQNLFEFDTSITNIQYSLTSIFEIPRIRITPPLRLPSQRYFVIRSVAFTIEQGLTNPLDGATAGVDMAISRDGGQSFGNNVRIDINPSGSYQNRFIYQRCGFANDASFKFQFSGYNRFIATDGLVEVYQ